MAAVPFDPDISTPFSPPFSPPMDPLTHPHMYSFNEVQYLRFSLMNHILISSQNMLPSSPFSTDLSDNLNFSFRDADHMPRSNISSERQTLPSSSPPVTPSKPDRLRASGTNPCFGCVEGAGKGGKSWGKDAFVPKIFFSSITLAPYQTHPLPLPENVLGRSTQTYNRKITDMVQRVSI